MFVYTHIYVSDAWLLPPPILQPPPVYMYVCVCVCAHEINSRVHAVMGEERTSKLSPNAMPCHGCTINNPVPEKDDMVYINITSLANALANSNAVLPY